MVGRAGESAVLGCDLLPAAGQPPLHVIEWLRFGFLLPIFIQFGLYSPRVDPDYVGKTQPPVRGIANREGLGRAGRGCLLTCSVPTSAPLLRVCFISMCSKLHLHMCACV